MKTILSLGLAATICLLSISAALAAEDCTAKITEAAGIIEKTETSIKKMARLHKVKGMLSMDEEKATKKLLDQARQNLTKAQEKQGKAKSDREMKTACTHAEAALEKAMAANMLHMKSMKQ